VTINYLSAVPVDVDMNPDKARVLQSLEQGTEGFNSVLDRLNGTSQENDFLRYSRDEIRSLMGEDPQHREHLSASD
jgi:hypothetical protein